MEERELRAATYSRKVRRVNRRKVRRRNAAMRTVVRSALIFAAGVVARFVILG